MLQTTVQNHVAGFVDVMEQNGIHKEDMFSIVTAVCVLPETFYVDVILTNSSDTKIKHTALHSHTLVPLCRVFMF